GTTFPPSGTSVENKRVSCTVFKIRCSTSVEGFWGAPFCVIRNPSITSGTRSLLRIECVTASRRLVGAGLISIHRVVHPTFVVVIKKAVTRIEQRKIRCVMPPFSQKKE